MKNRVCEILGIEKPIVQGPMTWLTNAEFVAAVSNAGGLGVFGPHAGLREALGTPELAAENLRDQIRKACKLTNKPFGVNVIVNGAMDRWTPPQMEVIKQEKVPVVVYTGYGEGGIIPEVFADLKSAGIKIIYRDLNPTPMNTARAEAADADIIVATGFDEGGTLPGTALGTFTIVPLIVDAAKKVPVMAAGGIADSRTAKAAFALGAEGIFIGSAFIATKENPAHQFAKEEIVKYSGLDLALFRTLPDYYRSTPGKFAENLVSMDKAGKTNEEISKVMGGLRGLRIGMLEGDTDNGYISVGTGIGAIKSIRTVAEVVDEFMKGIA